MARPDEPNELVISGDPGGTPSAGEGRCLMAHKKQENKNVLIELTLRVRIRRCRIKIWSIIKWMLPLLASLLAKVVSHLLHHG